MVSQNKNRKYSCGVIVRNYRKHVFPFHVWFCVHKWELVRSLRGLILILIWDYQTPLSDSVLIKQWWMWRHNGCDGISNHQPHECWLNRLFRRRSRKTSMLCVTGLCAGSSPVTGEFPPQSASNAENVSIWWRHHACCNSARVPLCIRILSLIFTPEQDLFLWDLDNELTNPLWYGFQSVGFGAHIRIPSTTWWRYHFPRYWPFMRGIYRSPANSPHKGQWRGAFMFSLICAWINGWVNNRQAGDLRCHRAHCDVSEMKWD